MTPDQLRDRERHSALMAVAHALTADERERFLDRTSRWPDMDGADVADVLDLTVEHDEFLAWTEPFYERHAGELPDTPGVIFALHALIILDQRPLTLTDRGPTLPAVLKLLFRTGVLDTEHEAQVRNLVADEVADEMTRAWDLNYCTSADAPKLDRHDALSMARHAMSRLAVIRERDHFDPLS